MIESIYSLSKYCLKHNKTILVRNGLINGIVKNNFFTLKAKI